MEYLWLVILVLSVSTQNVLVGVFNKKVKNSTPCILTLFFSVITILGFVFVSLATKKYLFSQGAHIPTIICGIVTGLMCALHFIFFQLALRTGPVSLTTLFVSYSLLIPTIFSIFYNHDTVDVCFFIGIPFLIASIALTNVKSKSEKQKTDAKKKKINFWWIIFVLLAVATNGGFAICQQIQQKYATQAGISGTYKAEFYILAMTIVAVFNIIMMFARKKDRENIMPSLKNGWYIALANGVAYFIIQHMTMMLIAAANPTDPTAVVKLPMSIVNPVLGAGSLVLTLVASIFIFKEKLSKIQWTGVALGVVAIVLLNLKVYPVLNKPTQMVFVNPIKLIRI